MPTNSRHLLEFSARDYEGRRQLRCPQFLFEISHIFTRQLEEADAAARALCFVLRDKMIYGNHEQVPLNADPEAA